jgi:hypothetical protein
MLYVLLIVVTISVIGGIDNQREQIQVDWHFSRVTSGETVLFEK